MKPSPSELGQLLRDARALLASGWIQRQTVLRLTREGQRHDAFCATGALLEAGGMLGNGTSTLAQNTRYNAALRAVADALPSDRRNWLIADYNDEIERSHADMLALFDRAIASVDPAPLVPR